MNKRNTMNGPPTTVLMDHIVQHSFTQQITSVIKNNSDNNSININNCETL